MEVLAENPVKQRYSTKFANLEQFWQELDATAGDLSNLKNPSLWDGSRRLFWGGTP